MVTGFGIFCVECQDHFNGTIPQHNKLYHPERYKEMRLIQDEAYEKAEAIRNKTKATKNY